MIELKLVAAARTTMVAYEVTCHVEHESELVECGSFDVQQGYRVQGTGYMVQGVGYMVYGT